MIRLIIFDADNTLYKTRRAGKLAYRAAILEAAKLTDIPSQKLYNEWAKIVKRLQRSCAPRMRDQKFSFTQLLKAHGAYSEKNVHAMYEVFLNELLRRLATHRGVKTTLRTLRRRGVKLAVISEEKKELLETKLSHCGLLCYFDAIVSRDTVGQMKPSPEYYRKVLDMLNTAPAAQILPSEVIVMGDSYEKDLKEANTLGMVTVLFAKRREGKPNHHIREFAKVLSLAPVRRA